MTSGRDGRVDRLAEPDSRQDVRQRAFAPGRQHLEPSSGRHLDLSAPDPAAITPEDVAHGVSHACRFAGQCCELYTAAEHALLVSSRLESLGHDCEVCLAGLHHDDAEALIGWRGTAVARRSSPASSQLIAFEEGAGLLEGLMWTAGWRRVRSLRRGLGSVLG